MENKRKEEKQKTKKLSLPEEEKEQGKECPNCHVINELEAKYCAECGHNFEGVKSCPKCGARVISPNADICEVCGEWLLEGQCKFCYAELEEGATFCPECGNPVSGIVCPTCGQLSYFDFCKFCNTPLTGGAQQMVEKLKNKSIQQDSDIEFTSNQEARRYYMAQRYLMIEQEVKVTQRDESDELLKMKEYIERVEKKEKKKRYTPLFSEKQIESIRSTEKIVNKEIERQEEERRKRGPKGWVCYAFNFLHPGGPNECAKPYMGGYWL